MLNELLVVSSDGDGNGRSGVLEDLVLVHETRPVCTVLVAAEDSSGWWSISGTGVCS